MNSTSFAGSVRVSRVAAVGALLAACGSRTAPPLPAAAGPNLEATIHEVRRAFRADGTGFTGGDATYAIHVERTGAFRVEAFHVRARAGAAPERLVSRPVGFETVGIAREAGSSAGAPALSVRADGSIEAGRGEAVEALRNVAEGVEQAWRFARAPRGSGDLVVRVAVSAPRSPVATASGLHFLDASGLGLRYGHATWVDASGMRTPVTARWKRGAIVLAVPAKVLAASAYPAVLDPVISPEHGIDPPLWAGAMHDQIAPAIASDGMGHLAVWVDGRAGGTDTEIWGARVYADGTVADRAGFRVSSSCSDTEPAVASDLAGTYLVAWICTYTNGLRIVQAARVSSDGAVLDLSAKFVSHGGVPSAPRVAFAGTDFLVVWKDLRASAPGIYLNRVSRDGTVLDAADRLIVAGSDVQKPDVACAAQMYTSLACLASFDQRGEVEALNLTRGGTASAAPLVLTDALAGAQRNAAVARVSVGWVIAFEDDRGGGGAVPVVSEVLLRDDGTRVNSIVSDPNVPSYAPCVSAANPSDPGSTFLAWRTEPPTGPALAVYRGWNDIDVGAAPISAGSRPAVSGSNNGWVVVTAGGTTLTAPDVWSVGYRWSDHARTGTVLVTQLPNSETEPAVAGSADGILVAFTDDLNKATMNWGTEIHGVFTGSNPVRSPYGISFFTSAADARTPALAAGAGRWLVAWRDERPGAEGIYASRVSADGTVLDLNPVCVGPGVEPAVAFDGTTFVVGWINQPLGAPAEIRVTRVDPTAADPVLQPCGVSVPGVSEQPLFLSAGSGAGAALMAWHAQGSDLTTDVFGSIVQAGTPSSRFVISSAPWHQTEPSVVPSTGGFTVAWTDGRSGTSAVYLAHVGADGTVVEPQGVAVAGTENAMRARIGSPGDRLLVAWLDQNGGVHAVELTDAFGTIAPGPFAVSTVVGATALGVGCDPVGECAVVWQRNDRDMGTNRLFAALVVDLPNGHACTAATECRSGICVDGVCCDTACGGGDPYDCLACSAALGAAVNGTCGSAVRGIACRPSIGDCDAPDLCDGVSSACPDGKVVDGTLCNDGNACTNSSYCAAGVCIGADPVICPTVTCNEPGVCQPASGACSYMPKPQGTACDDGDACTRGETCSNGLCVGGAGTCWIDDQCAPGTCDPVSGRCPDPLPDGTTCEADRNRCTVDVCRAGVCTAGPAIVCTAPDACHGVPACDTTTGTCGTAPEKADGTACDADGSPCTAGDACRAGVCAAGPAIVCTAPDACHGVPACDAATGMCGTAPLKADGTPCDADGSLCTTGDACRAGVCTAGPAIVCTAPDACHGVPACDTATGACGTAPEKADGTPCDADGSLCTAGDACRAGVCTAGPAIVCTAPDACHGVPACDTTTGTCGTAPEKADGTPCDGGSCETGTCVATSAGSAGNADGGGGCGCGTGSADGALAIAALVALVPSRRRARRPRRSALGFG